MMKGMMKILAMPIAAVIMAAFITSMAVAQGNPPLWHFPDFTYQPLMVPALSQTGGTVLIDNFEYWDSPYNHGWMQLEPSYPVYGFGLGYATVFQTVLDLQEGSRVLDARRPSSIFLLGTPYQKHYIVRSLLDVGGIILDSNLADPPHTLPYTDALSFKFRAPMGIEHWDIFEFVLRGTTTGHPVTGNSGLAQSPGSCQPVVYDFEIRILPVNAACGIPCVNNSSTHNFGEPYSKLIQAGSSNSPMVIESDIGRGFLDGTWHITTLDLHLLVEKAFENEGLNLPNEWRLSRVTQIMIGGWMFRVDNIMFKDHVHEKIDTPDLFEVGPRYAQIFEPYRYLFIADYAGNVLKKGNITADRIIDLLIDSGHFLTDPDDIRTAWVSDLTALSIDTNYADPNSSLYGQANSTLTELMGRGIDFIIDINLPVFSDANFRIKGSEVNNMQMQGSLQWNATIGGFGANGIQTVSTSNPQFSAIQPLPINPYDGMPTYIPAYYSAIDAILATTRGLAGNSFGKSHYGPLECYTLESALWNSGIFYWPNITYMDYTPYVFEDLIISVEVTNGVHNDVMTFPISVINYPVENYPPIVQIDIDDQIFHIGRPNPENDNMYAITFVDPDCFIFSLANPASTGTVPATTHVPMGMGPIRTDQDNLTYKMTLNGLRSLQYGPWLEQTINPQSGLIHFIPQFEGAFDVFITCTDDRGASGNGAITIFAITPGTWLNHPPIISGGPTNPVVLRAGEEYELHAPLFNVFDPDGDELYASCNIGSCGRCLDGAFIWNFQSNFPGYYDVEIIFYDIRGGYAILWFPVIVKPWWSF